MSYDNPDVYEGEATNILSQFILDNRDNPRLGQTINVLFSGLLYDWEKPSLNTEIEIGGQMYRVTGISPPTNPGNPNVNIYYVKPLPEKKLSRSEPTKKVDHVFWEFTDI